MGNIRVEFRPQGIIPRDSSLSLQLQPLPVTPGVVAVDTSLPTLLICPATGLGQQPFGDAGKIILPGDFNHVIEVTADNIIKLGRFPSPTNITLASSDPQIICFALLNGAGFEHDPTVAGTIQVEPAGGAQGAYFNILAIKAGTCALTATCPGYNSASIFITVSEVPHTNSTQRPDLECSGFVFFYGRDDHEGYPFHFGTTQGTDGRIYTVDTRTGLPVLGNDLTTYSSTATNPLNNPSGYKILSLRVQFWNNVTLGLGETVEYTYNGLPAASLTGFSGDGGLLPVPGTFIQIFPKGDGANDGGRYSGSGFYPNRANAGLSPNGGEVSCTAYLWLSVFATTSMSAGIALTIESFYKPYNPDDNSYGAPITLGSLTLTCT